MSYRWLPNFIETLALTARAAGKSTCWLPERSMALMRAFTEESKEASSNLRLKEQVYWVTEQGYIFVSGRGRGRGRARLEKALNLYERRKTPIVSEIPAWSKSIATQRPRLEDIECVLSGEMSSSSVEDSVGTYEIMDTVRVSLGENGYLYTSHDASDSESSEH
jgi:hypothetical protein